MGKKVFKLEEYAGNYVMHCDTEDKSKVFLEFLHIQGRMWGSRATYRENTTHWNQCKENTVYYFNEGTYGDINIVFPKYIILDFDDFIFEGIEKLAGEKIMKYDNVNNPKHYQLGELPVQSFDVIMEVAGQIPDSRVAICIKDTLKYLIRAERKNGLEDYKKAQWYLNKAIEYMEK